MLSTIIVVLVILWLPGFIGHVGGGLIHIVLVVGVVILICRCDRLDIWRARCDSFAVDPPAASFL